MNTTEEIVKAELDPPLMERGFLYRDLCYFKNHSSGLTSMISLDFDGESFRVFLGVSRQQERPDKGSPPEGAYLYSYFTGGSLSNHPKDITFKGAEGLRNKIGRLRKSLEGVIFPFFSPSASVELYADNLRSSECMVAYDIYQELGLKRKAIEAGKVVLEHYKNMRDIPKIQFKLLEVERSLGRSEGALNKLLQRIKKSFAFLSR
ncbi:hypothetical protein [Microbulbifer hainanensis]|uniref:hypothetical protein n=1 Tax=Microbulbifer hainanensis TaxID=2735675 RepID=UPI0018673917|nr:hypothetical protein [Microbulbifer hainanensis]